MINKKFKNYKMIKNVKKIKNHGDKKNLCNIMEKKGKEDLRHADKRKK